VRSHPEPGARGPRTCKKKFATLKAWFTAIRSARPLQIEPPDLGLKHTFGVQLDGFPRPGAARIQAQGKSRLRRGFQAADPVWFPEGPSALARKNHQPSAATCGRQAGAALGLDCGADGMFSYSPSTILRPPCSSLPRAASRDEVGDLSGLGVVSTGRPRMPLVDPWTILHGKILFLRNDPFSGVN